MKRCIDIKIPGGVKWSQLGKRERLPGNHILKRGE
jgi:hypothetical protein